MTDEPTIAERRRVLNALVAEQEAVLVHSNRHLIGEERGKLLPLLGMRIAWLKDELDTLAAPPQPDLAPSALAIAAGPRDLAREIMKIVAADLPADYAYEKAETALAVAIAQVVEADPRVRERK